MNRSGIFDTVRTMLRRGFRDAEVAALDLALDRALGLAPPPRMVGAAGVALIKAFEGCARRKADGRFEAYPDPASGGAPWTIGWGATGPGIGRGTVWSQAECDVRFHADLARHAAKVETAIGNAPTTVNQFDALVSFQYNTGAIARAALTRMHIAGDHAGAAAQFARWNRAAGRVMPGLTRRRAAERRLYLAAENTRDMGISR